jgi:hypothetical protein
MLTPRPPKPLAQYLTHHLIPPYLRFPVEHAIIPLPGLSLFELFAALFAVFVSRKPLFINKLYCIYVCYTNVTSYIVNILSNTTIHEELINDEARQQLFRPYQPSSGMAETSVGLPRH